MPRLPKLRNHGWNIEIQTRRKNRTNFHESTPFLAPVHYWKKPFRFLLLPVQHADNRYPNNVFSKT